MKTPRTPKGFTLIELLVVIGIIALLASIAVPAFTGVQIRAAQTKALSNAKQIGLACKQFAIDNNGLYPTYQWSTSGTGNTLAATSTQAFENLFPTYLTTISLFYLAKSPFTPGNQPPDPSPASMSAGTALATSGQNEWAYVTGLYDTSNSTFPLIADGFNSVSGHTYTNSETTVGGVWKGAQAIVIFADDSGKVMKTNGTTYTVPGSPNGQDLFDTSGQSGWMTAPSGSIGGQTVVNPQ
jgi:prepilin-type N-terminal cleavage/methylation domain-containing protein